ncbi:MAG: trypsin-like peptidase domain-containing protein [Deltaproteobacteria bacterium]|nr:trypsin-like peptidase domain-containing protein [Deltaproteobacteria bacterium]
MRNGTTGDHLRKLFLVILTVFPTSLLPDKILAQAAPLLPQVVAKVRPSIVQITTRQVSYDILLRPVPSEGVGSGVIFDPQGRILTNSHVVGEAKEVRVVLPDGRRFTGRVVGRDPVTDLAVVAIKGKDLPFTPLGDSSKLEVGETLIAIGNALGLEGGPTVTVGVVSALNRSIEDPGGIALHDLIQTDAAINPGNSGGPLVNLRGQLVGINTAMIASAQGIGFAIAVNTAKPVAKELLEKGRVVRPWLGIASITITPALAASYDLPAEEGVFVARVERGSPASKGGVRVGDIIVGFGGEKVKNLADLRAAIGKKKMGEKTSVEVQRDSKRFTASVVLGKMPES